MNPFKRVKGIYKLMKKLLLACTLTLSLCVLGGCNKDDEPGSGKSNVSGNVKIDGKTINLKYGYYLGDEEYYFYDRDILKLDMDELMKVELSGLAIECEYDSPNTPEFVSVAYKVNDYKETGIEYYCEVEDLDGDYISFSNINGKVNCSAKSLPMEGYNLDDEKFLGDFNASISVKGSVNDISDWYDTDDYSTRGIEMKTVTNPKEIALIKSFMPRRSRTVK